jgi:hypothetical protein
MSVVCVIGYSPRASFENNEFFKCRYSNQWLFRLLLCSVENDALSENLTSESKKPRL